MTKLHHEITINAPVEKVFRTLADLESVKFTNFKKYVETSTIAS